MLVGVAKLREAEVLLGQGTKVPEMAKALGVSEVTYYRWRKEYGASPSPRPSASKSSSARTRSCAGRSPT
jgi:transposase